jgi:hypothetical protein
MGFSAGARNQAMFSKPRTQTSFFWRICDIVCAFLLIFYVLFDVLDLDGSNVCRIANRQDHSAMVGEGDAEFRLDNSLELTSSQSAVFPPVGQSPNEFTSPRRAKASAFSLSVAGRSHGDRGCRIETSAAGASPYH